MLKITFDVKMTKVIFAFNALSKLFFNKILQLVFTHD